MPFKDPARIHETAIKEDFMKLVNKHYPLCHARIIPASHFSLLPYDAFINWQGIMRAVEFKVDDYEVAAHQIQALYEVVQTRGYAFVVRWLNGAQKFVVDNFSTGDGVIFTGDPSERQLNGDSVLDDDEKPAFGRSGALRKVVHYIMSFDVSPLESRIQDIMKTNYQKMLKERLGKIR